jgi:hypothetical protein
MRYQSEEPVNCRCHLLSRRKKEISLPPLPSAHTSGSIHREEHRFPKGKNMTGNTKGGTQWETRAAKRTKTRTGNRRRSNMQKI